MRLSLTTLLIAMAVFGLLLAAVAWPNQFWTEIVGSTTFATLTAAALAAIALRTPRRWFCLGFAIVGFAYLLLVFPFGDETRPFLLTHRALIELDDVADLSQPKQLLDGTRANWTGNGEIEVVRPGTTVFYLAPDEAARLGYLQLAYPSPGSVPSSRNYYNNGHLAWTWLLATAAGAFMLWLRSRSPEES